MNKNAPKKLLPETPEIKIKKEMANIVLKHAYQTVKDMGLLVVNFDAGFNELMTNNSMSVITKEEWDNGIWRG